MLLPLCAYQVKAYAPDATHPGLPPQRSRANLSSSGGFTDWDDLSAVGVPSMGGISQEQAVVDDAGVGHDSLPAASRDSVPAH